MTVFVDASALVAILQDEPGAKVLAEQLARHDKRLTSAIALWEAARAIQRDRESSSDATMAELDRYCTSLSIEIVPIGNDHALAALQAHERYGKGTGNRAQLNMGDCFAYACAKTNGAKLLYKGNDFIHTDLK